MLSKKSAIAKKTYLALSLTTALVAASQPVNVQAAGAESFGSKIVDATEIGNAEEVVNLLERGINPNERGQFGTAALLRAANSGNLEIAEILLDNGANVNVPDIGGATALHIAARKGDVAFTNFLLANGAKVNAADKEGNTPLMLSAVVGSDAVAGVLLRNGADTDATNDSGETALHYATEERSEKVLDLLLAQGAATDFIDSEGYTAPEVAERKSDSLLVAKLDKRDPNHVMISMGSGFKSLSSKQKARKAAESSKGKQLIQELAQNDVIDLNEVEFLTNPSDPELRFFEPTRFEPASGEQKLAAAPKKSWLEGLTEAFDDVGAFDLASVQNFQEGNKYSLVELGSFKLRAFAEKRISELKNENPALANVDLVIFERGSGENIEYYINGGVFETLAEAEGICKELAANGTRCTPVETALISNEQYASFGAGSSFSAPSVEVAEIAEAVIPEPPVFEEVSAPLAITELKEIESELAPIALPTISAKENEAALAETAEIATPEIAPLNIPTIKVKDIEPVQADIAEVKTPTIDDIVDEIYQEKEAEIEFATAEAIEAPAIPVFEAVPEPKLQANTLPEVETKLEQTAEVKKQIEALPTLNVAEPEVVAKKEPVTIKFATPEVTNDDTFKPTISASRQRPVEIANNATRTPILLNSVRNESLNKTAPQPEVKVTQPVQSRAPSVEALPKVNAAPAPKVVSKQRPAPLARTDKFTVAKPVRVNDAYTPAVAYNPKPVTSYNSTAATVTYNDVYIPPVPSLSRSESRRMVKVNYFASADSAMGLYWKYRENGALDENITVRATRDLTGSKPHYSSLIGEFRTNADAQAFCNRVYSAEKLRCSVIDEIDYSVAVNPVRSVSKKSYQRHSSRNTTRRSNLRHSSR